jgi:hypothetical protein
MVFAIAGPDVVAQNLNAREVPPNVLPGAVLGTMVHDQDLSWGQTRRRYE